MKKKIFIFKVGRHKFDLINHQFKLEFVDPGLYFVQDENNCINPLLQVGSGSESGSGSNEIVPEPAGQKSMDPTGSGSSSLL